MSVKRRQMSAPRRRKRKTALALRDGQACFYCRVPFPDLRLATLDHVVPYSLLRTWSASCLVLACWSCNQAKDDRVPLLLALALLAAADSGRPTADPIGRPASRVDWRLLARLAHANKSADPTDNESATALHESTACGPLRQPTARPDCLRAPRPVRPCAGPTPEVVFA